MRIQISGLIWFELIVKRLIAFYIVDFLKNLINFMKNNI